MFLIGKGFRPKSVTSPFKNAPQPITNERLAELVPLLKQGDRSVADEITLGHVRLAIYVAGLYCNFAPRKSKDLVSESFLALVEACADAPTKLKDDDFTRFAAYRMHKACGRFVIGDNLVKMPISTKYLHGLKHRKIETEKEIASKSLTPLCQLIYNERLDQIAKSEMERRILDLCLQGYTHAEISQEVGLERTRVTKLIAVIKKRYLREES